MLTLILDPYKVTMSKKDKLFASHFEGVSVIQRWHSIWCTPPEGALLPNESVDNSGEGILCCEG